MTARVVKVGDHFQLEKAPISKLQLVKYSGASGDFNPIHTDDEFAKSSGYPGVFAHGMLSMAFVGELLSKTFGAAHTTRLHVRFKSITWPGDVVTCHAEVTSVDGDHAALKVWAATAKGITVEGTASVRLA